MKKLSLLLQIGLIVALLSACTTSGPTLTITAPNNASAIAWTPSGDAIVANGFKGVGNTANDEGAIGVWEIAGNQLASSLVTADDPHRYNYVSEISVNPNGSLLLLTTPYTRGTTGGFVSLYDMKANLLLESWEGLYLDGDTTKPQETIRSAAFSPDGSKIAVIGSFYVRIFDNADRSVPVQFSTNARGGAVNASDERLDAAIAWSPDGTRLAWTINGNLSVYTLADGSVTVFKDSAAGSLPAPNLKIAWSPDGSRIAYESGGAIQFVDAVTGSLAGTLKITGYFIENHLRSLSYSPDGSKLVLCTAEYVGVWTLADQKLVFEQAITKPENEFDRFNSAVFSPDGTSLAILQYGDKQILIYQSP